MIILSNEHLLSKQFENDGKVDIYLNSVQQESLNELKNDINNGAFHFEKFNCDCGTSYDELVTISKKDRYGLNLNLRICPNCGLMMANPRMTQESYNKFYDIHYRRLYDGISHEGAKVYYRGQLLRGKKVLNYVLEHAPRGGYI